MTQAAGIPFAFLQSFLRMVETELCRQIYHIEHRNPTATELSTEVSMVSNTPFKMSFYWKGARILEAHLTPTNKEDPFWFRVPREPYTLFAD